MIPVPPIQWIPVASVNYWHGMGQPKVAIVNHTTGGGMPDGWFQNPSAQASTNFAVDDDGAIHGYIDPRGPDAPFANGVVRSPSGNFPLLYARQKFVNPNFWTVSIEHKGNPTPAIPTPEMFHSSVWLNAWCCQEFGIPADRFHQFSHTEIDVQKPDPGWTAETWAVYLAAVQIKLEGGDFTMAQFDELMKVLARLEQASSRIETALYGNFPGPNNEPWQNIVQMLRDAKGQGAGNDYEAIIKALSDFQGIEADKLLDALGARIVNR